MSNSPLHSVSVAGVTFDDQDRVLLIKRRDNNQWQAPGGVLELNETFEEGVRREVLEESGFEVEVQFLTGIYKNMSLGVVALVYRCTVLGGEATTSEESVEVNWFDVGDAIELMSPAFAVRVTDAALELRQHPASRAHDGNEIVHGHSSFRPRAT